MIKATLLYPSGDGKTFDMDYYSNKHIPLVKELLGDALKSLTIEQGLNGGAAEYPAPYLATASLYFDSMEAFNSSFGPNMKAMNVDVPNYTNIRPVLLVSEVIV